MTIESMMQRLRGSLLMFISTLLIMLPSAAQAGAVLSRQSAIELNRIAAQHHLARNGTILIDDMIFSAGPASIRGFTPGNRWPSASIPIAFDGSVDATKRAQFMNACSLWSNAGISCVVRTNQINYILVAQHNGEQCGGPYISCSRVGMVGGGQPLWVFATHWGNSQVVAHEIGHALGLIHEHMRSDRNSWVQVFLQNADPKSPPQFAVSGGRTLSAYDMKSIMHYTPCTFAAYGDCGSNYAHRVIEAKNCRIKDTPQPSSIPTAYDNFSIKTLYQLPGAVDPGPWMPPFQPVQIPCGPSCKVINGVKYGRVNYNEYKYYIPPVPPSPMTLARMCTALGQAALPRGRKTVSMKTGKRLIVTVAGECGCPNTL